MTKDGNLKISVIDDGRGIKDEDKSKLFKIFGKVNKTYSEGIGLGLAICKEICN